MFDSMAPLQKIIDSIGEPLQLAIKNAFEAGYRAGEAAAIDRILKAAGQATSAQPTVQTRTFVMGDANQKAHWNSSEVRPFRYGAVANAFRQAMRKAPAHGMTRDELLEEAGRSLNAPPNVIKYRDTFKRLRESNEMLFSNGRYFAGPGLIGRSQNENGALIDKSESAPEDEGGATPSNESQASLDDLLG